MSRLGPEDEPRLVPQEGDPLSRRWAVELAGVAVAIVQATFTALGDPVRVSVHPDVDTPVPVHGAGVGWVVDQSSWADYRCDGCGKGYEGEPPFRVTDASSSSLVRFDSLACVDRWVHGRIQAEQTAD